MKRRLCITLVGIMALNGASTFASENNSTDIALLESPIVPEEEVIIDTADLTPEDYNEETGELNVLDQEVSENGEILPTLGAIPDYLYEGEDIDEDEAIENEHKDEVNAEVVLPIASPVTYSISVANAIENNITMSIQTAYDYGTWEGIMKSSYILLLDEADNKIEEDVLIANETNQNIIANISLSCEYVRADMNMSNGTETINIASWTPATPEITGLNGDAYTISETWTINAVEHTGTIEEAHAAAVTALSKDLATATVVYSYTPVGESTPYTITINYTSTERAILTIKSEVGAYLQDWSSDDGYADEKVYEIANQATGLVGTAKVVLDVSEVDDEINEDNIVLPSSENYEFIQLKTDWWIVDANATPTSYSSKTPDGTTLESAKEYLQGELSGSHRIAIRYDSYGYVLGLQQQSQVFVIYELAVDGPVIETNLYETNNEYTVSNHLIVRDSNGNIVSNGIVYANKYNTEAVYDVELTTFHASIGAPAINGLSNKPWNPVTPTLSGVDDTSTIEEVWTIEGDEVSFAEVKTLLASAAGGEATVTYTYTPLGSTDAERSLTINYKSVSYSEMLTLTSPTGIYMYTGSSYLAEKVNSISTAQYYGTAGKGKISVSISDIDNEINLSNLTGTEADVTVKWYVVSEDAIPVQTIYQYDSIPNGQKGETLEGAIAYLKANQNNYPRIEIRYQSKSARGDSFTGNLQLFAIYELESITAPPIIGGSSSSNSGSSNSSSSSSSSSSSNNSVSNSAGSNDSISSSTTAATAGTTIVKPTIVNGISTAMPNISAIQEAISKAQDFAKTSGGDNAEAIVAIKVDTSSASMNVQLSSDILGTLVEQQVKAIEISNGSVQLALNNNVLDTITKAANGAITLQAEPSQTNSLNNAAVSIVGSRPIYDLTITDSDNKLVSDFGNDKIQVTIPYEAENNEIAENLFVYYINNNGAAEEIPNSKYNSKTNTIEFGTNHFSTFGIGYRENIVEFTDISSHWAIANIEYLAERGIIDGMSSTEFAPNINMTREVFVTALGRIGKVDYRDYTSTKFNDVSETADYLGYVAWANENSVIDGTSATTFYPEGDITREQMAKMIYDYATALDIELPALYNTKTFTDESSIGTWAKEPVKIMQLSGLIKGREDGSFDPQGTATRAEVSAVLQRLMKYAE